MGIIGQCNMSKKRDFLHTLANLPCRILIYGSIGDEHERTENIAKQEDETIY